MSITRRVLRLCNGSTYDAARLLQRPLPELGGLSIYGAIAAARFGDAERVIADMEREAKGRMH